MPAKMRLGWRSLPGTSAVAYYKNSLLTTVKSLITLAPGLTVKVYYTDEHASLLHRGVKLTLTVLKCLSQVLAKTKSVLAKFL